jgi:Fic family protein
MGKIRELLKDVALPPDIESQVRLLDLHYETLEKKYDELVDEQETRRLEQPQRAEETRHYTTQRIADPNDPTPDELAILKVFQPGQELTARIIAAQVGVEIMKATARLNELERKGYPYRRIRMGRYRHPNPEPIYCLADLGIEYLADH